MPFRLKVFALTNEVTAASCTCPSLCAYPPHYGNPAYKYRPRDGITSSYHRVARPACPARSAASPVIFDYVNTQNMLFLPKILRQCYWLRHPVSSIATTSLLPASSTRTSRDGSVKQHLMTSRLSPEEHIICEISRTAPCTTIVGFQTPGRENHGCTTDLRLAVGACIFRRVLKVR